MDDIVGGLQTYLAHVQTKAAKKEKDFDMVLQQNESLQEQLRNLETEMSVMDQEATGVKELEHVRHSVKEIDVQ